MRLILCFLVVLINVELSGEVAKASDEDTAMQDVRYPWNPNDYQVGYYLGEIVNSRVRGFPIRSLEMSVMLGRNSARGAQVDTSCQVYYDEKIEATDSERKKDKLADKAQEKCTLYENPAHLSSMNKSMEFHAQATQAGLSMIFYRRYFIRIFTQTRSIVKNVYSIADLPAPSANAFDISKHYFVEGLIHYGRGEFHGRIVHAYLSGKIRPVYTIVVQEGESGNTFHRLNVAKRDMFDFIVEMMSTGKMLRIAFLELFGFEQFFEQIWPGYTTRLRVTRVELLNGPSNEDEGSQ